MSDLNAWNIPTGTRELRRALRDALAEAEGGQMFYQSSAFHAWVEVKANHLAMEAELLARCFQEAEALRSELIERNERDPRPIIDWGPSPTGE